MEIENQVAIVTGAASGIGYAYTKFLLQNNVKVALCDINIKQCQSVANEFSKIYDSNNILALKCDVTDQEQFENAFISCIDHFKRLDIVVNNAGIFNESMENWQSTMNINYGGVVRGTMLAIKYMGAPYGGKGGTVVQTGSIAPFLSVSIAPMYKSTKRAVLEYTRAIGDPATFEHLNVRVMALCPGYVDTPLIKDHTADKYLTETVFKLRKETINKFPVQTPDNVGKALIEILKNGTSGDCWIVENNENPRPVNIPNVPY